MLSRHPIASGARRFPKKVPRMSPSLSEFTVLRQTIASRGTVRMTLLPVTLIGWAGVMVGLLAVGTITFAPALSLLSLGVLVGGFEAIHALHVGVERIGRYLQVYYEGSLDDPRWETTAMAAGPALPGGGIDPLFTAVFVLVSALNLTFAFYVSRTLTQDLAIGAVHGVFWARVIRARGAAARQRAVDLETFRAIKSRQEETKT
jgi:hypothetical protein